MNKPGFSRSMKTSKPGYYPSAKPKSRLALERRKKNNMPLNFANSKRLSLRGWHRSSLCSNK